MKIYLVLEWITAPNADIEAVARLHGAFSRQEDADCRATALTRRGSFTSIEVKELEANANGIWDLYRRIGAFHAPWEKGDRRCGPKDRRKVA